MFDKKKMEQSTAMFLDAVGHPDWQNDPNTKETPKRVSRMWETLLGGYDIDTSEYEKTFPATSDDAVFSINNKFFSFCSHHFMPFVGVINVGYIPNGKVIGLSKIPRIARAHAKKLNLQEDLTKAIADDLTRILKPQGVAVQISAIHFCQSLRGVRSHGAVTVTTHLSGLFKEDAAARNEFLEAIKVDTNVFKY